MSRTTTLTAVQFSIDNVGSNKSVAPSAAAPHSSSIFSTSRPASLAPWTHGSSGHMTNRPPAAAAVASVVHSGYDHYDYLCKLLVIGDSGCGKSSLLKRFADDEFHPAYSSTIGVDFEVRSIDVRTPRGLTKTVKMQMWDTAGQERFRTITSSYYRGAHAVLIVFDVTSEESFHSVKRWLQEVDTVANRAQGRASQILLVANKTDLVHQRCVESHRIAALAEELGLPFVESSAKTNVGVTEAFTTLAGSFVAQRMEEEAMGGMGGIGGPGGKKVPQGSRGFHGVRMDYEERGEEDRTSVWKKCMGACSIM